MVGLVSGCSTLETKEEARIAALCRSYSSTLTVLAGVKQTMTRSEINTVDDARRFINPICRSEPENTKQALIVLSRELNKLFMLEQKYDRGAN